MGDDITKWEVSACVSFFAMMFAAFALGSPSWVQRPEPRAMLARHNLNLPVGCAVEAHVGLWEWCREMTDSSKYDKPGAASVKCEFHGMDVWAQNNCTATYDEPSCTLYRDLRGKYEKRPSMEHICFGRFKLNRWMQGGAAISSTVSFLVLGIAAVEGGSMSCVPIVAGILTAISALCGFVSICLFSGNT
jgi:hypothetical protein